MSVKKKVGISDLLRDEAQKGTDESILEIKAEVVNEQAAPVVSAPANVAAKADPLTAALAQVNALESALAASQSREADLQKELQFSKTNVELLQKSLTAIETLKSDLEQQLVEVKRDNLRLAETNIQLSEQVKSLEAQPAVTLNKVESAQLAVQPAPNHRATPRKQPVEQPYPHRDRNPYARPTGSNEQLQKINNKNIGWMD
jgi:chromosome segregation ATPase